MRAADWMTRERYALAATVVHEVGKPYKEADADVKEAIDFLRYYAKAAVDLMKDRPTQ